MESAEKYTPSQRVIPLLIICSLLMLTGCETTRVKPMWPQYEGFVYDMYHNPSKALPEQQIPKLEKHLATIEAEGRRAGPGLYIHLGYMYYSVRMFDLAQRAFEREQELYPESEVFVTRLLKALPESGS